MFMSHLPMHINILFHLISSIDSIETRIVTNISDISVIKNEGIGNLKTKLIVGLIVVIINIKMKGLAICKLCKIDL